MTRKDYVKFADAIRNFRAERGKEDNADLHVEAFMKICTSIFSADNPRFDSQRFYRACEHPMPR